MGSRTGDGPPEIIFERVRNCLIQPGHDKMITRQGLHRPVSESLRDFQKWLSTAGDRSIKRKKEQRMQSFYLNLRTEIYFGRNSEARTAEAVRKHGGGRILLVYGGGSVIRSGLLDRLTRQS